MYGEIPLILNMRYFLPIILLGGLLFVFWNGLTRSPLPIVSPLIMKPIPHFAAMDLSNPQKMLTEKIFSQHISLLVVWSSWCDSCLEENAFLMHLKNNNNFKLVGLNYRDKWKSAMRWLEHYGNPYHETIFDPNGLLGIHLGVYGVPETFLIDKSGIILYKHIGPLTEDIWKAELEPLLEGK
jgi:cytochrome c biogenesis protein CcmG, thiol:disulfide interchange protein DsbE